MLIFIIRHVAPLVNNEPGNHKRLSLLSLFFENFRIHDIFSTIYVIFTL